MHAARRSKLTVPETLARMRDAGLDSIPGGGAEILVDRVRDIIAPKKVNTKEWLGVMREAHRLGISTTATMMYGHVETLEERVEHFRRVRELQDETGGFRAFFSWTFQDDGNRLVSLVPAEARPTSFDYLLTQAVSRIYLDNMPHIGSSWVTQGKKIGQVALGFGADDLGSVMIEENVVSAAGTTHRTSAEELVHLIRSLGKTAVQRDTLYRDRQGLGRRRTPLRGPLVRVRTAALQRRGLDVLDRVRHLAELDADRSVGDGDERPLGERAQNGRVGVPVVRDPDAAGVDVQRVADPARPLQVRVPARQQRRVVTEERLERLACRARAEARRRRSAASRGRAVATRRRARGGRPARRHASARGARSSAVTASSRAPRAAAR